MEAAARWGYLWGYLSFELGVDFQIVIFGETSMLYDFSLRFARLISVSVSAMSQNHFERVPRFPQLNLAHSRSCFVDVALVGLSLIPH
jgi:hypothetical protein